MSEVANAGRTVLFISHNMAAVTSLCTRAILLDQGRFMADGDPNEIVQLYLSRSTNHEAVRLDERMDRTGNGLARIESFSVADQSGVMLDAIVSGQNVVVNLEYSIPSGQTIDNGVCILVFKTQLGQPLFTCSTRLFNEYVRLTPHGRLSCHVPHFPLNQGGYYVDVHLKQGSDSRDVLDCVENAAMIQVLTGDFFGTGRATHAGTSPVLIEHHWSSQ
jgi:lipopolysaccharide transport system ATP-binding protein